ncbi:MAG: hypothetical protein AAB361_00655 [Patescibacteria group bacterium]
MSVENTLENRHEEKENLTPEQLAENLTFSHWNNHLQEFQNPNKTFPGGDWGIAKAEAYLEKIKAGNFYEGVKVEGTYDGEPRKSDEPSVYDFFKEVADTADKRIEAFKESPILVEKFKKEGEEAQKIIEAIEAARKGKTADKPKRKLIIGAKKNPDGTIDYSSAVEWDGSHTEKQGKKDEKERKLENTEEVEEKEEGKIPEFQRDVKAILKNLDELGGLLDAKSFRPHWPGLSAHLNKCITGITAERRALGEISLSEATAMAQRAQEVESKMKDALEIIKLKGKIEVEIFKDRKKSIGVDSEVSSWLSDEGPKVMQSLISLHTLESGKIKNRRKK